MNLFSIASSRKQNWRAVCVAGATSLVLSELVLGGEALSREFSVFNRTNDPAVYVEAISRDFTVYNRAGTQIVLAEAISRAFTLRAMHCPGDGNGDRVVNFLDLNFVLTDFGSIGAGLLGDVNGDGLCNFADLNDVLAYFGVQCS